MYLADLELLPFLKYANLLGDYQYGTVWSAPEVLASAKMKDATKEMDIYSFGIIMWELLHDQVPFDNNLALARNYVLKEDARPLIGDHVDGELARLIRLCWLSEPEKRPSFQSIYGKLNEL